MDYIFMLQVQVLLKMVLNAGGAFCSAIISRIANVKLDNTIAMTGEIDLRGCITKIGGLNYKLQGAKKAGVKIALVPKENEKDYKGN